MRTLKLFGWMLLAAMAADGRAEPSSKLAWTPETLDFVKRGNAEKGQSLAAACDACHGPNVQVPENPALHGQSAAYLYKQLHDYKDGSRSNAIMAGFAAGLSDQDMADLAAWYSRQPGPKGAAVGEAAEAAEQLVEKGDGKRILTPCAVCHGDGGQGLSPDNPALAGQKAAYLEQTLLAYKSGARHNDVYSRMRLLSQRLSDEEIRQLARYYAGLNR
jgi:cytochrome c553